MVDWKAKLSSRKFWSLLIALIVATLAFFGVPEGTIGQVVAMIGAFSSIVIYILAEAYVDSKAVSTPTIEFIGEEIKPPNIDSDNKSEE